MSDFIFHIATVEIPVTNLRKSIAFYTDILGVEVKHEEEKNAMLTFNRKGVPTLFLVETEEYKSLSFTNSNNGMIHSAIDFYTPNLNEFYNWLVKKKVEARPLNVDQQSSLGGFGFKDPDGNVLGACHILHQNQ